MNRWLPMAIVAVLVVLASPTLAQAFLTPGGVRVELAPGESEEVNFSVRSAVNRTHLGFVRMEGALATGTSVDPAEFRLGPAGTRQLTLTIDAEALEQGVHTGQLIVNLIDPESGATQRLHANLTADIPSRLLLFNAWRVDLPAPLDGATGLFLLEVGIWVIGALLAGRAYRLALRRVMSKATRTVRREAVDRVRVPLFVFVVASGIRFAWRFLPERGLAGLVAGLLDSALVLLFSFLVYRVLDSMLVYYKEQVAPRTASKWDDVVIPVMRKLIIAGLVGFAFFYALQGIGVDLSFLIAGGLVVGLVLSASLGPTLANLFSGLFLMMDRPFVEGDDIRLDSGEVCNVRRIGLRSTRLYFYRNHELFIVPNKDLESTRVVNLLYPDTRYKMHIPVGVAYGSDVRRVTELLLGVAHAHDEILTDEESIPRVLFDEFGDSALLFRLIVFVPDVRERFRIASELRYAIDDAFRAGEITIPFPQRTVWMNSKE